MKNTALSILAGGAIAIALVASSNTPPRINGNGCITFPGTTPQASLCVNGSGQLILTAGGTNQSFMIVPTGTGGLTVNQNAAALPAPVDAAGIQLGGIDSGYAELSIDGFAKQPVITTRRADGTNASKSAVQTGETLLTLQSAGYGATGYGSGVIRILPTAAENWTDAAQGAYLRFQTTPTGTVATANVLWLFGSGGLSQTSTDPGAGFVNALNGFKVSGSQVVDSSENLFAGAGSNIVYRCTAGAAYLYAGTAPSGCISAADTGLRVK